LRRSLVLRDRNDPAHHVIVAFFDSHASAMENSNLPETQDFSGRMGEFVDGNISFLDLDVVQDR
jgi:hypothetical protein